MEANLARVAALVGEPARARMLVALLGRRALTATELADLAGVTAPTASAHLAKMTDVGLLTCLAQGRHRYYLLASASVARMLEGIAVVAESGRVPNHVKNRVPAELREARTCYDHLAGRVAVALAEVAIRWDGDDGEMTAKGRELFTQLGITQEPNSKRVYCRPCVDWSERRPHIAGALGAAILERLHTLKWIRHGDGRAIHVTDTGKREFARYLAPT